MVKGSVGHMSAFMAQAGTLVVLGDAGEALGDSLYEAPPLRARQGEEPRLRLHREAACATSTRRRSPGCSAEASTAGRSIGVPPLRLGAQALPFPHGQSGGVLMGGETAGCTRRRAVGDLRRALRSRRSTAPPRPASTTFAASVRSARSRISTTLLFLGASISRYPLEGYREKCATDVMLGTRLAKKPIQLKIPITIAGMSFGSLSAHAKEALGRGASAMGTSTTTGDGGMTEEERQHSRRSSIRCCLALRHGTRISCARLMRSRSWSGQGAKPGGGGMLLGQKISERVAEMRTLPEGIDQRSACRHPDWTGPDDLEIKIHELREITDWEKPIYVKVGAARPYYDTALAVKAGADVVVLDGMQGGTAATQDVFIEHVGIPTLAAIRPAVQALQDLDMHRKVQLIVSGGIRNGADVAKALALGADAVSIGTAALIALGDNDPQLEEDYRKLGTTAGCYDDWHEGRDPAGITTQDPELTKRLDPVAAGKRLANYLSVLTLEAQTIARACGKSHVHNLEPEDLVALTVESAAMAQVPLAGTSWIPGGVQPLRSFDATGRLKQGTGERGEHVTLGPAFAGTRRGALAS